MQQNKVEFSGKKLSIVLPIKNAFKYFEILKSQLISNISDCDEIIIVDDFSTDSAFLQFKSWSKSSNQIQVVKNIKPGFINALNFGISIAQNEWIARWDQDDEYSQDRLKTQVKCLDSNTVAVFSDFSLKSDTGEKIGTIQSAIVDGPTKISVVGARRTAHSSAIFNRLAFYEVGGYFTQDFLAEDISLWLRLSSQGKFETVPRDLLQYQVSRHSLTGLNQVSSKAKRIEISKTYRISQNTVSNTVLNWEEVFEFYDKQPFSLRRKILFLLDLYSLSKFSYKVPKKLLNTIFFNLLKEQDFLSTLNSLRIEKNNRSKVRLGIV
jgi:glycosyltransferase involved in cell wall biosynthesis